MTKKTGLTILGVGLGINIVDYLTAGTGTSVAGGAAATSQGGIFYGPGRPLASFPYIGIALIGVGGIIWLMK